MPLDDYLRAYLNMIFMGHTEIVCTKDRVIVLSNISCVVLNRLNMYNYEYTEDISLSIGAISSPRKKVFDEDDDMLALEYVNRRAMINGDEIISDINISSSPLVQDGVYKSLISYYNNDVSKYMMPGNCVKYIHDEGCVLDLKNRIVKFEKDDVNIRKIDNARDTEYNIPIGAFDDIAKWYKQVMPHDKLLICLTRKDDIFVAACVGHLYIALA